jgi:NADH dehydrogenase FAD-containing subunit
MRIWACSRCWPRHSRKGIEVTLVSERDHQLYSGMIPGHLAGHYALDQCSIPLDPVADKAGVEFVRARVR